MEITENVRKRNNLFILLGLLTPLRVPYFPLISPLEVISIIYFIQSFFKRNYIKSNILTSRVFKSLRILFFLWIGSQTVSDILNKVTFAKSIKGIGAPFLVYITLLFIIDIYEKNHRDSRIVPYYFLGHSLSFIFIVTRYSLNSQDINDFFKWGGLFSLTMLGLILLSSKFFKLILILVSFLVSLLIPIRAHTFIILTFIASKFNIFKKKFNHKLKDLNIFKVILGGVFNYFLIILLFLFNGPLYSLISKAISTISLNNSRSVITAKQKDSLFDARLEYYTYFEQFKDSPFFGKGSWAVDKDLKYTLMLERRNPLIGGDLTDNNLLWRIDEIARLKNLDEQLLPLHSFLFQVVIWGGILSGLFFFYLLNLNISMILDRNLNSISRLYIALNIYNIFFSPLDTNRFNLPIICFLTIIYFIEQHEKSST